MVRFKFFRRLRKNGRIRRELGSKRLVIEDSQRSCSDESESQSSDWLRKSLGSSRLMRQDPEPLVELKEAWQNLNEYPKLSYKCLRAVGRLIEHCGGCKIKILTGRCENGTVLEVGGSSVLD